MNPWNRPRRNGWIPLVVAALALSGAGCATTGSVVGKVDTKDKSSDKAVVTADSPKAEKSKKRPPQALLQVIDGKFTPSTLLVDPGTVVRVENHDKVWHNAFSVASASPFDVGGIAPGKSATVKLDHAGVLKVFCEFHSKEAATIVVAPQKARTQPGSDGNYRLGGLPAGTYRVSAWHPSYGTKSKLVAVAPNEQVTVNFRY